MIESAQDLIAAARTHGLELEAGEDALDRSGADFLVLHARDARGVSWIVRAPLRPDVLERAAAERRTLEHVGSRLPVAVPQWRIFSPEVIAYPRLAGEPAAVVDLSAGCYVWRFDHLAPPAPFISSVARALAALHRIELEGTGLAVKRSPEVRAEYASRMAHAREVLSIPPAVWQRWQAWLEDDRSWPEHPVLVHGDLHPAHILVDESHRVSGIIDWTEAHGGDPATDFALLFATLGEATLAVLLQEYAAAGARTWQEMQAHVAAMWSAYPVMIAEFARSSGQDGPLVLAQSLIDAQA